MTEENRRSNAELEWQAAREAWGDAEVLTEAARWNASISRLYYSVFHAARALLLLKGLEPKTHEGVNRLFSLHYALAEELPHALSRTLGRLQKHRGEADYTAEFVFTEDDVEREKQAALEFLEQARDKGHFDKI